MKVLLVAISISTISLINAQNANTLEICGVPFRLGMTRAEVEKTLVIPAAKPEARQQFIDLVLGRKTATLTGMLFGLPESSDCSGILYFKDEDVVGVEQNVASTADAMALVNIVFLELAKLTGGDVGSAAIDLKKVRLEEQTTQLASQIIFISINGHTVKIATEQGHLEGTKIGPIAKVSVSIAKGR